MCDPVTIGIALATSAGQAYFQNKAANQVEKAQHGAQETFTNDIKKLRDTSNTQFQNSVQQATLDSETGNYDDAVEKRTMANMPSFDQKALLPGQGNASGAVRAAIVQSQDRGINNNANASAADAKLNAFGDVGLNRDIALKQNENRIRTQGGFAQGSLNNLQADVNAAQYAGDGAAGIADLIGAVGTIAGPVAGYGAGQGWWGGLDPATGITWNTGRQAITPGLGSRSVPGAKYIV